MHLVRDLENEFFINKKNDKVNNTKNPAMWAGFCIKRNNLTLRLQ